MPNKRKVRRAKAGEQLPLFPQQRTPGPVSPTSRYSDYVVYVDESGDHSLENVDENYPVFVLAFCVFQKAYYARAVVPSVEQFKFKHFGHDVVVLHETDIRKEKGDFRFSGREHKEAFLEELTGLVEANNFMLIASVIDKRLIRERSSNPYHLALGFCLETLTELLAEKRQGDRITHVIVEARGKKEDRDLELEFRRICGDGGRPDRMPPYEIVFADKKTNSSGLQLADLVARPIGLSVIRPQQPNRAFDVLRRKFFCRGGRELVGVDYEGLGLKIYPALESERPR